MRKILTTYHTVTPESAEVGDFAETGWIDDEGVEIQSPAVAIQFLRTHFAFEPSSSHFHPGIWYSDSGTTDDTTGEDETRSYHLTGFTERAEKMVFDAITDKSAIGWMSYEGKR